MLDPNYIREYPEEVKENIRNRGLTGPQFDVADFLQVDEKRRSLMTEIQGLRALKNKLSDSNGQPASQAIQEAKKTKEQIKALECDLEELTKKWQWYLDWFPNMAHASMPIGKDASGNVELKVSGEKKTFSFEPKHHITLGEELDLIDTKKSAETSGSRWYFLKNEAVLLQRALFNLAVDKLTQQGFTLMIPPVVLKYRPLYGTGYFPSEESQIYELAQGDRLEDQEKHFLSGTSEQALVSYRMDEIIKVEDKSPIRYGGLSTCFRSEAGSWGKDTRGIKRVHQFDKVEMIYFTTPETSQKYMQEALALEEAFLKDLELTYHVIDMCTGDVGLATHRKFDVEVWLPGQQEWMETHSNSDLADYQSRRLNIRFRRSNGSLDYPHTISATYITNARTLVAILDTYQQADGSVIVPKVLRPYMNGLEVIESK